jgi:hypothetical protein
MNVLEKLTALTGEGRSVRLCNWGYGTWSACYELQDAKNKLEIKLEVTGDSAEEAIERLHARVTQAQKGVPEIVVGPMLTYEPPREAFAAGGSEEPF